MAAESGDPGPTEGPRFVNAEVPCDALPDALPDAEAVTWVPLHPRFARRLQVGALLRSVVLVAVGGVIHWAVFPRNPSGDSWFPPWLPALLWTALGAFCAWSIVWPLIAVPRRGYVVREKDILYRSGVLWCSVRAFPLNRVQHIKRGSTPLDRRFGLASLWVFPAGGTGSRIRGLGRDTAERLRAYISERIGAEAEAQAEAEARKEP